MGHGKLTGVSINLTKLLILILLTMVLYVTYNSFRGVSPKSSVKDNKKDVRKSIGGIGSSAAPPDLKQEATQRMFILRDSPSEKSSLSSTSISSVYSSLPSGGPEDEPPQSLPSVDWVFASGNFIERLKMFNDYISKLRREILLIRGNSSSWKDVHVKLDLLWMNSDDWMEKISRYNQVRTIALPWDSSAGTGGPWNSRNDTSNVLIQSYYPWSASEPLCGWIRNPEGTRARWDAVYGRQCSTNYNMTQFPASLEIVYLHGKPINKAHYWPHAGLAYPHYFYTTPPRHVLYMNIIQDAVVTTLGDFISGNLKLVLYSCSQDLDPRAPADYKTFPLYEEVFVISQYWGEAYFHRFVESFPRISPYLEFLKDNTNIKILISETGEHTMQLMSFLGLNHERFITGDVRAKVVYVPQATPCGFAQVQGSQLLSRLLREELHRIHGQETPRSLVLIKRSGSRHFTQQMEIEDCLQQISREYGLRYEIFPDNPPPSLFHTMRLFNRAVLVVAPHGAGLANLVFAEPGAFVIEGVCNRPHVNMCFQRMAHILGHHYHGIPSRGGCEGVVDVSSVALREVVSHAVRIARGMGLL